MFSIRTIKTIVRQSKVRTFCHEALPEINRVGFIGLGQMGYRMCKNLIKKGFDLSVFDLNEDVVMQLKKDGGTPAKNAKELVSNVDCIITMLPTGSDLLCLYTPDLVSSIKPTTIVIDSSTVEHTVSKELANKLESVNVPFIDAPVSGGILGAENATLTFMVGGDEKIFKRANPVLNAMGKNLQHCGKVGSGQIAKACNNLILGISMAGLCEAMAVGIAHGLDAKVLTDIINSSSGQCWSSSIYNPVPGILPNVPSSNGYKAGFSAQLILKDLGIANEAAKSVGLPLNIGKKTYEIYDEVCKNGFKEKDFSIVYQYFSCKNK